MLTYTTTSVCLSPVCLFGVDSELCPQGKEAELTHAQAEHAAQLQEAHARQASLSRDLEAATEVLRQHQLELGAADALLTQERERVASTQQELATARSQLASCRYDAQRASSEHVLVTEALHLELQHERAQRDNLRQLYDDALARATDAERRAGEVVASFGVDLEALAVASDAAVAAARQAGRDEAAPAVAALEVRVAEAQRQQQADGLKLEQLRGDLAAAEAASHAQGLAAAEHAAQAADVAQGAMERLRSEVSEARSEVVRLRNEGAAQAAQAAQATEAAQSAVERLRGELQSARDGDDEAVRRMIANARDAGAVAATAAARAELALPLALCAAQHRALGTAIAIGRLAEAHSRMQPSETAHADGSQAAVRVLVKRCVRATAALRLTCHAVLSRGDESAQHALRASVDDVALTTDEVAVLERAIAAAKTEAAASVAHAAARAVAHERVEAAGGPYWFPLSRPASPSRTFSPTKAPPRSPSPGRRIQASISDAERACSPLRARLERLRLAAREALVDVRQ
jgi:hypothetical protein